MFVALISVLLAQTSPAQGWERQRYHFALSGETIEHARSVAAACNVNIRVAVSVPEAMVPKEFELWGVQFDRLATEQQKTCVLSATRITKRDYFSQAEADPDN